MSMRIDVCQWTPPGYKVLSDFADDAVFFSSELQETRNSWTSLFDFKKKSEARENFRSKLYSIWIDKLKADYRFKDETLSILSRKIDAVVDQACFNLGKSLKDEMTKEDIHAIGTEMSRCLLAIGHKPTYRISAKQDITGAQKLFFKFLIDEAPEIDELATEQLIRAFLWKKHPGMLQEARECLQDTLEDCFQSLKQNAQDDLIGTAPNLPLEAAIGNLLAIYPFLDPQEGEIIFVPRKINSKWHYVAYCVEKIQLTPSFFPSPMFAYGLKPLEEFANFAPILLFKGTTYPTDDGAFLSILSDLNPFASVGEYVFHMAKDRLGNWIDQNTARAKAHIYGASLGGSLTLQAAIAFSSRIEEVHAYSPPALWNRNIQQWDSIQHGSRPQVFVYCNEKDIIPHFGSRWARDWKLIQVFSSKSYNPFLSHCRIFSAGDVVMLDRNIEKDHHAFSRRFLSTIQLMASLPIFCFLATIFFLYSVVKKLQEKFFA